MQKPMSSGLRPPLPYRSASEYYRNLGWFGLYLMILANTYYSELGWAEHPHMDEQMAALTR